MGWCALMCSSAKGVEIMERATMAPGMADLMKQKVLRLCREKIEMKGIRFTISIRVRFRNKMRLYIGLIWVVGCGSNGYRIRIIG